ncbi:sodium/glutamate symporter [Longimicrobium terrae]|uniref:Sodium/glutamate symporter n=1 Tax=Longimicrobium terrae TaxID=1639882 RepID=A0A841GJY3_9BACT|nr:sodium/glutamate symporter [Longimicrobium terrae]MBB4634089.1 ESS family glutamate:Na+ symporter [Longimicrobium terrae]MBB6069021.1 ESS family glutamate:Na+ symporter [Longimicrobium terrae]NNC28198.1 sodium/glutamate symporter [Longimicrobium terrae]
MKLDLIQTVAFAGVVLFLGYGVRKVVRPLARYNIPAPVIGGLIVAVIIATLRSRGQTPLEFDTTLQSPMMVAFFTTIGFAASFRLLKVGGPQVLLFFGLATAFAVVQNLLGAGLAAAMGLHPLFGVLTGSVTLTGGPATGLAFAPLFEAKGVTGATTIAVTSAMVGIVMGGVVGAPIATRLIERNGLRTARSGRTEMDTPVAAQIVEAQLGDSPPTAPAGEDEESFVLLQSVVLILVAMWVGGWVSAWMDSPSFKLPSYIGAMLVAAVIRNLDDVTGWFRVSQRVIDDVGNAALALFIVMALMTLKLWELANLAGPMLVILAAQVLLIAVICMWPVFPLMGRDYESAVMSGGFVGFMLGTTANAMANMRAIVEKYGPAPRAFLVVPMVGAFFIDFTNALVITGFVNFFK